MNENTMKSQVFTNIQRLRAIAALLVVCYHIIGIAEKYGHGSNWVALVGPWGSTGVDLFFVISGFIMVHIQQRNRSSPMAFFAERLMRIAPLYWLLTATLLILLTSVPAIFNSQGIEPVWAASSFAFLSQAYTGKMPVLFDGWTLEYEMFFYLVFALALNLKRLEFAVVASAAGMLLFYVATGHMIVLEFALGMLLGLLRRHWQTPPVPAIFALAAGLIGLYFAGTTAMQGNETRAWAVGIPATFIVYAGIYLKQWPSDWLTKLGDASYSIYLVQVFTISGWYKLVSKAHAPDWNFLLALGCIAATAAIGLLTHHGLEKPLSRRLNPLKARLHDRAAPIKPGG
jgi:exopolysaccharide production protein ExoZ